jgi:glycosyltransferase involved in cell wall biosynthesis
MLEKMSRAAVIRSTDVDPEPRTQQAIKALESLGFEVTLLNWRRSGEKVEETRESFKRISFTRSANYGDGIRNLGGQIIWQTWIARNILAGGYGLVYACDADTALTAAILRKIKSYKLIYDQFDPIYSRFHNKFLIFIANQIEKILFRICSLTVVANKSRKFTGFGNQIVVSNNFNKNLRSLKRRNSNRLEIAYFGVLQPDRGLLELVKSLENVPTVNLTVAGFGSLSDELKSIRSKQFRFLGKIDYEKGLNVIVNSDISYVMYNPTFEHNRNTASGKFLDSIMAGTPCIVAQGTVLADHVREFDLGWALEYGNVDALNSLLESLVSSKEFLLDSFDINRKRFLDKMEYSNEESLLTVSIDKVLKGKS